MLDDAKKNSRPFDYVLVENLSRISRNTAHVLHIVDTLALHGVSVYDVAQSLSYEDPPFRIVLTLCGMLDEQYITAHAEKVRRGQKGKVLLGYTAGSNSFGYTSVALHPSSSKTGESGIPVLRGHRLEIVESQAAVIRRIYAMFADGHSAPQIAKTLNDEKIPASGSSWNSNLVRRVLRDEKYRGTITWNKTKRLRNPATGKIEVRVNPCEEEVVRVDAPHLRIVTNEQSDGVRQRLSYRRNDRIRPKRAMLRKSTSCEKTGSIRGHTKCQTCQNGPSVLG